VERFGAHHFGAIAVPQFTMLVHWHTGMMLMRMIIITQFARVGNANDYHYAICLLGYVALHHCDTSASLVLGRRAYVSKY
jgi:hypothetical protein